MHITLTGLVILDKSHGTGGDWRRDEVQFALKFHGIAEDKLVEMWYWAPFVTLNSISNEREAINAGWAVDAFRMLVSPGDRLGGVTVSCDVAVRDSDGYILRLAYIVFIVGKLVDRPVIP
ncbi:MAG: hypothetical protein ACLQPD_02120 [Desulfomonilaceae bacterium]